MNNHRLYLFIATIILIISITTTSYADDDQRRVNCSDHSSICGDIPISYPFYGASNRPDYCGFPGFKLDCQGSILTTTVSDITYRVLHIDYQSQYFTVVRSDYLDTYCQKYLIDTTIDSKLFNYASNSHNLSLYYGCPATNFQHAYEFSCAVNETNSVGYYMTRELIDEELVIAKSLGTCNGSVKLPVFESAVERLNDEPSVENLVKAIRGGFGLEWIADNDLCSQCADSGGICSYQDTDFACYCSDKPYAHTCTSSRSGKKKRMSFTIGSSSSIQLGLKLAIPVACGFVVIIVGSMIFCYFRRESIGRVFMKTSYSDDRDLDEFMRHCGSLAPKQYSYSDVKRITDSFATKLGQGGYGCVYRGKLSDGRPVAVKILNESKGNNGQDFLNEVASISRTSHVNVVSLLGFCYKGTTKRALIYEFMSNISLDKFIYPEKASPNTNIELDRTALLKISVGVARGLEYLHSGCNTRILHLDIKPHNILLDQDRCPKISDFGLAKLCQRKDSMISTMGARGTIGYIAPEVFSRAFGRVSYKSDVYSYGMMVLEMAGVGKSSETEGVTETSEMYFPNWIYKKLEAGPDGMALRDNEVTGEEKDKEIERKMILVGLWCIQTKPTDRPSMTKVIEMLEGSTDLLQTPPKPFLFSPTSRSLPTTYSSSSLSSMSQIINIQS